MEALVSAAATMSGQAATVVLEDFGVFIALRLTNMYGHLIPGEWKTLDVIEKTEETIHNVVRVQTPGAKPPVLHAIRRSEGEVVLIYGSPRKLCAFAIGIVRGVQSTSTRPSKLPRPSVSTMARPTVKLSSARDGNSGNSQLASCYSGRWRTHASAKVTVDGSINRPNCRGARTDKPAAC